MNKPNNNLDYNLICTSRAGLVMTLVFTNYNDLAAARREAKAIGYRDFSTSIGSTVECTSANTVETLKLYNKC